VFVVDVPGVERPLLMTDCVVNIAPALADKRDIAQNAIDLAHALGIAIPRMAILSAVETINPAIPGTIDAAALCKMAERDQIRGALLDGPLAFDNAISARSAANKGIVSEVAGRPDILLVPNLEAGNMVYKQLVYLAGAECAGLVLGMRVPIVLTSRSDSVASRVASCALAVLATSGRVHAATAQIGRAA
jgi:phosphate acetyltransferase